MKGIRRIGLFCMMAGVMFGAGSYATIKAEQFFYPNKYGQQKEIVLTKDNTKEQVIETAMEKAPVITADTLYLIEEVDLNAGTVQEREEQVPVKYIGLDRTELIEELKEYDKNPALSDLKLGFQTSELSSFSKDRVVVCKYYKPEEEDNGFYLMVADHFVIVYESDKETVHMNTDILLSSLSETLQEEIIRGKYVEDEQALYNFLESYSS
ncbi:MAG: hypothetical protein NC314_13255 [Roseburia sp.]|nr:hypothetical protein [Ruminococcus sp.]MCM1154625.1 hypothetical protein [Roseburia sp.]MCM1243804.1 hypothetical protein [Roseburia sp.]